ncbi:hypothetical protein ACVWZM_003868 [Bradyrhizobium sp. USDA 4501]
MPAAIAARRIVLGARDAVEIGNKVDRHLLEHRLEHRLLGREVMIDRALGNTRAGGDVVHRRSGEAALAKNAPRRLDDGGSGFLAPFGLGCHGASLAQFQTQAN